MRVETEESGPKFIPADVIRPHLPVTVQLEAESLVNGPKAGPIGVTVETEHASHRPCPIGGPGQQCTRHRAAGVPPAHGEPVDIRRMIARVVRPELLVLELEPHDTRGVGARCVNRPREKELPVESRRPAARRSARRAATARRRRAHRPRRPLRAESPTPGRRRPARPGDLDHRLPERLSGIPHRKAARTDAAIVRPAPKCVPLNGLPKLNAHGAGRGSARRPAGSGRRAAARNSRCADRDVEHRARLDAPALEVDELRARALAQLVDLVVLHFERRAALVAAGQRRPRRRAPSASKRRRTRRRAADRDPG